MALIGYIAQRCKNMLDIFIACAFIWGYSSTPVQPGLRWRWDSMTDDMWVAPPISPMPISIKRGLRAQGRPVEQIPSPGLGHRPSASWLKYAVHIGEAYDAQFSADKRWRKVPTHCNPLNPVSCAKGLVSTGEWADSIQRDTLSLNDSVDDGKWLCFHLPSRERVKCYACDEEMWAQWEKLAANVSAAEIWNCWNRLTLF